MEVLRGPLGTLYGSGSIAGTLRYITAQPQLGKSGGSVEVSLSEVSEGSQGGSFKGMVNAPIGDTAALRVVGWYDVLPGFIDGYGPNGRVDKDVNDGVKYGVRAALLFKPNGQLRDHAELRVPAARHRWLPAQRLLQHPR